MKKDDKSHRGNASQFFVAGELCRRGYVAVVTLGNCPNTDILCSDKDGKKFLHIQVKTFRPGDRTCTVGIKAAINYGDKFVWVLAGIPEPSNEKPFEYYMIPSKEMSINIKKEFKEWVDTPGEKGKKHNEQNKIRTVSLPRPNTNIKWDISKYRNNWKIIKKALNS